MKFEITITRLTYSRGIVYDKKSSIVHVVLIGNEAVGAGLAIVVLGCGTCINVTTEWDFYFTIACSCQDGIDCSLQRRARFGRSYIEIWNQYGNQQQLAATLTEINRNCVMSATD